MAMYSASNNTRSQKKRDQQEALMGETQGQDESKKAITIPGGMVSLAEAKAEHHAEVDQLKAENAAQKERADATAARLAEMQRRFNEISQAQAAPLPSGNRSSSSVDAAGMDVDGGAPGRAHAPPPSSVDSKTTQERLADYLAALDLEEEEEEEEETGPSALELIREKFEQANLMGLICIMRRKSDGSFLALKRIASEGEMPLKLMKGTYKPGEGAPGTFKPTVLSWGAAHTHDLVATVPVIGGWLVEKDSPAYWILKAEDDAEQEKEKKYQEMGAKAKAKVQAKKSKPSGSNRGSSGRGSLRR